MNSKKIIVMITTIILILVLLLLPVLCVVFINSQNDEDSEADAELSTGTNDDIHFDHGDDTLASFENGNELYYDQSLTGFLQRLELGTPKTDDLGNYIINDSGEIIYENGAPDDMEAVMDCLIHLINGMAERGYSVDASQQVQRFYVAYYDRFGGQNMEDVLDKLSVCFPAAGAQAEGLSDRIFDTFGFTSPDDFAFVFVPYRVADIQVLFCDVAIDPVDLTPASAALSIYPEYHNPENPVEERNLAIWLNNMIQVCEQAKLDKEKIKAAQLLYVGSLAFASYTPDWKSALVSCLTIEDWNYNSFKCAVENAFKTSIDHNVPLQQIFGK